MKWCSWMCGSRSKRRMWSLLSMPNQWHFIYTSLPTRVMSQDYFQASCLGTCYKSTSYALGLFMSPEKSSSSSTTSWIVGINWPSSPRFNGQCQGLSMAYCARSSSRKVKEGRRTALIFFLHLPYHPANPSSKTIQKLWHERGASLKGQPLFRCLTNDQGYDIPIDRLTIAWYRPSNLGNLLSYMKLSKRTGLKVSSYIKT